MPVKRFPHGTLGIPLSLAVIAAFVIVVFTGWSDIAVAAKQPKCGDTITTDTTLHADLVDCPNDGILIDANNVTLDLNGHTIGGDGTPDKSCNPIADFCDFGVGFENHHGINVKDGSIHGFESGLGAFGARHVRLLDLASSRNHVSGFVLGGDARVVVKDSSGDRTTDSEGDGIGLFNSRHVRILNSSFRHNRHVGIKPIRSTNSVVKGNRAAHNGDEGFLMEGGSGFRIRDNHVVRNGAGITLGPGSHNVIRRNRVSGGRDGIRIEKGHDNLVADNVVRHARGAGIRLGIPHPFIGGAHNTVRGNLVKGSRIDDFLVNAKDEHSLLRHNTASGAGDDGFDIQSHTAKLTKNRALRNADLGIAAARGVIDGGGNKASGNGDPRQCLNIVCN